MSGHPASDDLTILLISYRPRDVHWDSSTPNRWTLDIPCRRDAVPQAQSRLQGLLGARSVERTRIEDALLILEEIVVNIVTFAEKHGRRPRIGLQVEVSPDEVYLRFSDDSPPFDPLQLRDPELDLDIAERSVGGLGVFLVRKLADACRYEHDSGMNHFEVRLSRGAQSSHGDH